MKVRFGTAEAIGAGIGGSLGVLGLAFTGPLALVGLLVGCGLGGGLGWGVGRLSAGVRRVARTRFHKR
jgi:hypothetical protein